MLLAPLEVLEGVASLCSEWGTPEGHFAEVETSDMCLDYALLPHPKSTHRTWLYNRSLATRMSFVKLES